MLSAHGRMHLAAETTARPCLTPTTTATKDQRLKTLAHLLQMYSYSMAELSGDEAKEIPLPNMRSKVVAKVVEFCQHHQADPMTQIPKVRYFGGGGTVAGSFWCPVSSSVWRIQHNSNCCRPPLELVLLGFACTSYILLEVVTVRLLVLSLLVVLV